MDLEELDRKLLEVCIREEAFLTVNVRAHPLEPFRPVLAQRGFVTSRDLKRKPEGAWVKTAGRIVLVNTPPTRSGSRVIFITAEDEFGLIDMVLFPKFQKTYARTILSTPLSAFEGRVKRHGRAVSLVLYRVRDLEELLIESERREPHK